MLKVVQNGSFAQFFSICDESKSWLFGIFVVPLQPISEAPFTARPKIVCNNDKEKAKTTFNKEKKT